MRKHEYSVRELDRILDERKYGSIYDSRRCRSVMADEKSATTKQRGKRLHHELRALGKKYGFEMTSSVKPKRYDKTKHTSFWETDFKLSMVNFIQSTRDIYDVHVWLEQNGKFVIDMPEEKYIFTLEPNDAIKLHKYLGNAIKLCVAANKLLDNTPNLQELLDLD